MTLIIYEKETEGGIKAGMARPEVREHTPSSNLLLWSVELERRPAKSAKSIIVGTVKLAEYFPKDLRNIYQIFKEVKVSANCIYHNIDMGQKVVFL